MERLFHYTTASGLIGIFTSASLWATDLRFLNDTQESVYARDAIAKVILMMDNPMLRKEHWAKQYGEVAVRTFESYRAMVLDNLQSSGFGVLVTCFCESGDLLSQWRGYGGDHGYAIEFSAEALRSAVKEFPTYPPATGLFKVTYGLGDVASVAEQVVDEMSHFNLNHPGVKAHYSALAASSMLAQIKHPGFSEEQEWRLIVGMEVGNETAEFASASRRTQYRPSSRAIVPYVNIPVPLDSILSVRVGPGENAELRENGVRRLLATLGSSATVSFSSVPFSS